MFLSTAGIALDEIFVRSYTTTQITVIWKENTAAVNGYQIYIYPSSAGRDTFQVQIVQTSMTFASKSFQALSAGQLYTVEVVITPTVTLSVSQRTRKFAQGHLCSEATVTFCVDTTMFVVALLPCTIIAVLEGKMQKLILKSAQQCMGFPFEIMKRFTFPKTIKLTAERVIILAQTLTRL